MLLRISFCILFPFEENKKVSFCQVLVSPMWLAGDNDLYEAGA